MCFCGEVRKYPYRPVAEACGFKINSSSTPHVTDWGNPDMDIFTTNSSVEGWCNVDPQQAFDGKLKFKKECHCKYDGRIGLFCEIPVTSTCINQCSGHGFRGGFCQMALYESILASPCRTLNGDEADFFYVPSLDSCVITRASDTPHLNMQVLRFKVHNETWRKRVSQNRVWATRRMPDGS